MSTSLHWLGSPRPSLPEGLANDEFVLAVRPALVGSLAEDRGIVIAGDPGRGKTTLMRELDRDALRAAIKSGEFHPARSDRTTQPWLSVPSWWTRASDYVKDVRDGSQVKFDSPRQNYSAEGIAEQVKRLFVDDLGAEQNTPVNQEILSALLQRRADKGLPTWVTTRLSDMQFKARYGDRVLTQVKETSLAWVQLGGPDRRQSQEQRKSNGVALHR